MLMAQTPPGQNPVHLLELGSHQMLDCCAAICKVEHSLNHIHYF